MTNMIRRMRDRNSPPNQRPLMDVNMIEENLEEDIAALHRLPQRTEDNPINYAKPEVRSPVLPLPAYVEHDPEVSDIGLATAGAMVAQYETCSKAIEAMVEDLDRVIALHEQGIEDAKAAKAYIIETADAYRKQAAIKFVEIEKASKMVAEVHAAAKEMRKRIEPQ